GRSLPVSLATSLSVAYSSSHLRITASSISTPLLTFSSVWSTRTSLRLLISFTSFSNSDVVCLMDESSPPPPLPPPVSVFLLFTHLPVFLSKYISPVLTPSSNSSIALLNPYTFHFSVNSSINFICISISS